MMTWNAGSYRVTEDWSVESSVLCNSGRVIQSKAGCKVVPATEGTRKSALAISAPRCRVSRNRSS